MNKRNTIIFLVPWLFVIIINELSQHLLKPTPPINNEVAEVNSSKADPEKCSWQCHDHTIYCLEHHVKSPTNLINSIKPFYFGLIHALQATGNYGLANIFFLVILWPFFMLLLFIKILNIQKRINLKNRL